MNDEVKKLRDTLHRIAELAGAAAEGWEDDTAENDGAEPANGKERIVCTPKSLPDEKLIEAAARAREINPANHPPVERMMAIMPHMQPLPQSIALITGKRWSSKGVHLSVGFLDGPARDLRSRLLLHMNAWGESANVHFVESRRNPEVRIARAADGYWSYVGTDILSIADDQPTMNLEAFTMQTPESEFHRVVRHETGHTLGFPHEHMRRELVDRIDRKKAIKFFGETQGWTPEEVEQQVLTPLEEAQIIATPHADPNSIMCYQIPGFLTKDGNPILGGVDIDASDFEFAGEIYPKTLHTQKVAPHGRKASH